LYQLVFNLRDKLSLVWEDLFQSTYGVLHDVVLRTFDEYLNCGLLVSGQNRTLNFDRLRFIDEASGSDKIELFRLKDLKIQAQKENRIFILWTEGFQGLQDNASENAALVDPNSRIYQVPTTEHTDILIDFLH